MLINIPLSLIFLLFLSFQLLIGDICYFPIVFTELGISIDVKLLQLLKAPPTMVVILSGIE